MEPVIQKMGHRFLGNTGLRVSELAFGTMTLSITGKGPWGIPAVGEEESMRLLDRYAAAGGNFIDTADMYGESETLVGRWLAKQKRSDFIIATKARGAVGPGPNEVGLSRKHIFDSVEASLKALGTTYIDLYQCHTWDNGTPLRETFSALNDLVKAGKVHYVGVSNFTGWQLQKAIDLCNELDYAPIVSVQPQYSLLCRSTEFEILPVAKNEGLAVLCWSPLTGGWLSGKQQRPGKGTEQPSSEGYETGGRIAWAQKVGWKATDWDSLNNNHTWSVIDTVNAIGKKLNKTPAQIALRWLMQKGTIPIIGTRSMPSLEDNLGAVGWTLPEEDMVELNKASAIRSPYPYAQRWITERIH